MNTYPCNMLLDESGPEPLRFEHIQEQFAAIMALGMADARPDEIDWERIVANWDLPIPVKPSATNPYRTTHPKRAEHRPFHGFSPEPDYGPGVEVTPGSVVIHGAEAANRVIPGLGDLITGGGTAKTPEPEPAPPADPPPDPPKPPLRQGELF